MEDDIQERKEKEVIYRNENKLLELDDGSQFEAGVRIRCSHPRETETAEEDEDGEARTEHDKCVFHVYCILSVFEYISVCQET